MIFQEPMTALNPVFTDRLRRSSRRSQPPATYPSEARARAIELLRMVGMPEPETRIDSIRTSSPAVSGSASMIAMAIWPATGAAHRRRADHRARRHRAGRDPRPAAAICRSELGSAVLLITHDMGVVADLADRVVVMDGSVVETRRSHELFAAPHARVHPQAAGRGALGAMRSGTPGHGRPETCRRCEVIRTSWSSTRAGSAASRFQAVDGVDFDDPRGEVLGLVGESGSGKSTIGRAIAGLLRATAGAIGIGGRRHTRVEPRQLRRLRRTYAMVFQDPGSSLDPRLTIGDSIGGAA